VGVGFAKKVCFKLIKSWKNCSLVYCVYMVCCFEDINGPPPYPPCSFDRVLLDVPCSGLGQRPFISCRSTLVEVTSYPPLQRRLFETVLPSYFLFVWCIFMYLCGDHRLLQGRFDGLVTVAFLRHVQIFLLTYMPALWHPVDSVSYVSVTNVKMQSHMGP